MRTLNYWLTSAQTPEALDLIRAALNKHGIEYRAGYPGGFHQIGFRIFVAREDDDRAKKALEDEGIQIRPTWKQAGFAWFVLILFIILTVWLSKP